MTAATLLELAQLCGAAVEGDGSRRVTGPAPLEIAGPEEVSFFSDERYQRHLEATRAAGVLVGREVRRPDGLTFLRCDDPSGAFTRVIEHFAPERERPAPGVHPSAVVAPGAEVASDAAVGPLVSVGARSRIAAGAVLHAGVVVGPDCLVGEQTELHGGVVLYQGVRVGARCILHAGTVIGGDGFGFDATPSGWVKVPQCGGVLIEDDVEIGSNCTIDRARFGATRIARGVKIDNLVHVGHNCLIDEHAMLITQVGLGGTTRVGKWAIMAGQSGISGHGEIGDGARVGGGSKLYRGVGAGEETMPILAMPKRDAMRARGFLMRLPALQERLKTLEERLARLESSRRDETAEEPG